MCWRASELWLSIFIKITVLRHQLFKLNLSWGVISCVNGPHHVSVAAYFRIEIHLRHPIVNFDARMFGSLALLSLKSRVVGSISSFLWRWFLGQNQRIVHVDLLDIFGQVFRQWFQFVNSLKFERTVGLVLLKVLPKHNLVESMLKGLFVLNGTPGRWIEILNLRTFYLRVLHPRVSLGGSDGANDIKLAFCEWCGPFCEHGVLHEGVLDRHLSLVQVHWFPLLDGFFVNGSGHDGGLVRVLPEWHLFENRRRDDVGELSILLKVVQTGGELRVVDVFGVWERLLVACDHLLHYGVELRVFGGTLWEDVLARWPLKRITTSLEWVHWVEVLLLKRRKVWVIELGKFSSIWVSVRFITVKLLLS